MTVARYLDDWLPKMKRRVAPTTYQSREQHVRVHIKPVLATRRLGRLSVKDVESLLDGVVTKGASPRTAGHVRATLRVALQEAIRDGLLDRNVAADARAPRVRVPEMKALSPTQARALIEATKEDDLGVLWLTLLSTGLRAGEACGLSWGDIDEDRRVIHVRRQWARGDSGYELRELKTEASKRTVSISAEVTAALAGLRSGGETNEDPVFHTAAGDRLDVTQLSGALRKDLERAGLPVVRVHDLRHTAASLMLGAGADIVAVSRVLGHSTVVTTLNTYAHTDEARKADAVERLRKAITSG